MQPTRKSTPLVMGIVILVLGGCRSTQQSSMPGMNWLAKRGEPADATADYPAPSANAVPETVGSAEKLAAASKQPAASNQPAEYPATSYPNLPVNTPAQDSAGFLPDAVQLAQQAATTPAAAPGTPQATATAAPSTADVQQGFYQAQAEVATNVGSGSATTWDEPLPASPPAQTNEYSYPATQLAASGPAQASSFDAPRDAPWQSTGAVSPPAETGTAPAANDYSWPPVEATAPAYAGPPADLPVTNGGQVAQVNHETPVATPSHYEQLATQQAASAPGRWRPGSTGDFAGVMPGNTGGTMVSTEPATAAQPVPFMPPETAQNPAENRWE